MLGWNNEKIVVSNLWQIVEETPLSFSSFNSLYFNFTLYSDLWLKFDVFTYILEMSFTNRYYYHHNYFMYSSLTGKLIIFHSPHSIS